jgi:pimeloyl-ACP methyl ester carboxylesterase
MIIDTSGVTLYCRRTGSGPVLLLLHGNGEDHRIFDKLSSVMEKNFTVCALDSRNHGASTKTGDYTYETMARDIGGAVRQLSAKPVYIAGFSDGAIVALLLAMQEGHSIGKMALLGVNLKPEAFTDEALQEIRLAYQKTGDPLMKMMLEQPNIPLEAVKKIQTPTLIVAGENDVFKPESFRELAQAMPNARLRILPGHDHDSYIAHSSLLAPDLTAFFLAE